SQAEAIEAAAAEHVKGCPGCRRRLARGRLVVETLRGLPGAVPPDSLDERVLGAARPTRNPLTFFFRVAAAVLLLAGAGLAAFHLISPETSYPRLDLEVVIEGANGDGEEEVILEELFGPETPILNASGGEPRAGVR
ncbi:MAG: hypothetical protein ACYS99_19605, partial [Planctomycetota bacterium]